MAHRVDKHRRNGAFAVRYETNAFDADLRTVVEKIEDRLLGNLFAVVFLQHRVTEMAGVVAGAGKRHIDRDRRDAFSPSPSFDSFAVPGDFGTVQNQIGVVRHAGH